MKIQMTRGCIANSLTVDGKEEIDLSDNERLEVLRHIFEHLRAQDLNYVLQDLVETFGEYEVDEIPHPSSVIPSLSRDLSTPVEMTRKKRPAHLRKQTFTVIIRPISPMPDKKGPMRKHLPSFNI